MDASTVVFELEHQGIISDGDQRTIRQEVNATLQAQLLHACLKKTCDPKALTDVCDIIATVKGNPKMKLFGEHIEDGMGERCVLVQLLVRMLLALLCCVFVCVGGWVMFECMSLWQCCVWIHGCWESMVFMHQCVVCTVDMSLYVTVSGCTHAVTYIRITHEGSTETSL